jgi:aminoglycoside phosphotransferase (APT) family kinase protein
MLVGTLNEQNLQAYLDYRWGAGAVRLVELSRFQRGVSRETWGFEIENLDGADRPALLILRRPIEGSVYIPRSIEWEYEVAARLARTDVPVAHPLFYEDDPAWTFDGRPFFIREQIDGHWNVPGVVETGPEYDELRIATSKEMVAKLAMVHTVDWKALDFPAIIEEPQSAEDSAARAIRQVYRELEDIQFEPQPVLAEVKEWLLDNAPPAVKLVLLKGTNGLGEEVFREGRIVALSDWEQCSIGDPAQDFARTQDLLPHIERDGRVIWSMRHALDYYEELTGTHVEEAAVDYYRLIGCVEGAVYFHSALQSVADGTDPNIRRAYLATELSHIFLRKLLDATYGRDISGEAFGTKEAKEGDAVAATDA